MMLTVHLKVILMETNLNYTIIKSKTWFWIFSSDGGDAFLYDTNKVKIDLKRAEGRIFSPLTY